MTEPREVDLCETLLDRSEVPVLRSAGLFPPLVC